MKLIDLLEALKPSQYRPLRLCWNPDTHEELFKKLPYEGDRRRFRLYIPFQKETEIEVPEIIQKELDEQGLELVDYLKGLVRDPKYPKRMVKISKFLSDEARKVFNSDPQRAKKEQHDYIIVLSRHPYD
ncbi:MAG: hypothetical protein D6698_04720, partial [Gammaproteobacteria bacterium]